MWELRRILSNYRLLSGLILLVLVNGFLFFREQSARDCGLDCSLPASGVAVFYEEEDGAGAADGIDARAAYGHYLRWLDKIKSLPMDEAVAVLEQEKIHLCDIRTIFGLLEKEKAEEGLGENASDTMVGTVSTDVSLDTYRKEQPHLVRQIVQGKIDKTAADVDLIAIHHLLAQAEYFRGYGEWLDTIQRNKENMLAFPIFNNPDSFSGRNIVKTAKDFATLQGVKLSFGVDGAVDALMSFRLTDYFLLLILLLFSISFLEERKAGLWNVVHAAPNGRLRLAVHRILLLFCVSAGSVFLLYGGNLAVGFSLYGGVGDLGRAVQSVETLGKLTMRCSVGEFLVFYFLLRVAAAVFVGLLLWLLLMAVNNVKYTIAVSAAVLAAEYGLSVFLPVQSVWNGLKYFNIFTYICMSGLYESYLNINLFGYPVGIQSLAQLALCPMCLLLAAACSFVYCRKKPGDGKDFFGRIVYGIHGAMDHVLCHLHLLGMEVYKVLWIQKGIWIMVLFFYVATRLSFVADIPVNQLSEGAVRQYVKEFEGEITEDIFWQMDERLAGLERTIAEYEEAKIAYERGEITQAKFNVYSHNRGEAQTGKEGLAAVRERAERLWDYGREKGFVPWMVDEIPFESVYGMAAQGNQHKAAAVAVFALILLLAGSMAYERQSGMACLLRTMPRGREGLLICKLGVAAIMAAAVWGVVYGRELHIFLSTFSIPAWDVPVQNLSMLIRFPVRCSIRGWLVILYGYRLWMLFCGAVFMILVSSWSRRVEAACIAGCGTLLIPSLLYVYAGVEVLRPFAYLVGVEAMPLLLERGGDGVLFFLWAAVLAAMAGAAICSRK